ncbi:MAG: class I SAM-dependent methyltransferase [Syntrophales bacterium]
MQEIEEHYDRKYQDEDFSSVERIPLVARPADRYEAAVKAAAQGHGKYLEIGAGSGSVALSILDKYDELVLTDLSKRRVDQLTGLFKNTAKVRIHQNNIESEALGYPEGYFDVIALVAVVEHLFDPIKVLETLRSYLKPGGYIIVDTPNIAKYTRRIKLLFGSFPSTASLDEGLLRYDRQTATSLYDDGHLHYFTYRSLRKICLERCGFAKVRHYYYGSVKSTGSPFILARIYPRLFSEIMLVAYK